MADRVKKLLESSLHYTGSGWIGFYDVPQWTTSDTCSFSDFTTISNATVIRADTLAIVTNSVATNVVTLTQAAMTNVECIVMVAGSR